MLHIICLLKYYQIPADASGTGTASRAFWQFYLIVKVHNSPILLTQLHTLQDQFLSSSTLDSEQFLFSTAHTISRSTAISAASPLHILLEHLKTTAEKGLSGISKKTIFSFKKHTVAIEEKTVKATQVKIIQSNHPYLCKVWEGRSFFSSCP